MTPGAERRKLLLIASFPESFLAFRGAFLRAALDAGLSVELAMPDARHLPDLNRELEARGVRLHRLPLRRTAVNPLSDMLLLWKLYRLMRNVRPDLVMGYTIKPVIYGAMAAWLARVPRKFALVTGLGYAFTGRKGLLVRLIRQLYAFSLRKVDTIFFQNPDDRQLLIDLGVVSSAQRTLIVNGSGVDIHEYSPAALPEGKISYLLIARLLGDKGVREYVAAARRIKSIRPEVRFRLAGWIDENPDSVPASELQGWIEQGDIDFLGRLEDVREAIADCSVYVLPSYREGTPRTVLEAMAMGRAVITTDAPGCRETVVDGVNGFLVSVRSEDALVEAMMKFLDDPGLVARMGGKSREIAEIKYDVRKVNAAMLREMRVTMDEPVGITA